MNGEVLGHTSVELSEEFQEFLMRIVRLAVGDPMPVDEVEGGEQRGRAVSLAVVRLPLRDARLERQMVWVRSSA